VQLLIPEFRSSSETVDPPGGKGLMRILWEKRGEVKFGDGSIENNYQ